MGQINPNTLKSWGRRARERAHEKAGGGRVDTSIWWAEVQLLQEKGCTKAEISRALGLGLRRVEQIQAYGKAGAEGTNAREYVVPDELRWDNQPPDIQAMYPLTADAFKLFYERFSGLELPGHLYAAVQAFCDNPRLLLNMPPRHAKSIIFAVWVPVWLLCRNRNEEILVISKTSDLVRRFASSVAYILSENRDLIETFGRFAPEMQGEVPWRPETGELMVVGRARDVRPDQLSYLIRGAGQQLLGFESTCIIGDDATDGKTANSEVLRDKEQRWLQSDVLTRIMPESDKPGYESVGRIAWVGQRVHIQDMYGWLEAQRYGARHEKSGKPIWTTVKEKAVKDWDAHVVLWPEERPYDYLMELYESVGAAMFETMYQQDPRPEGDKMIDPDWWLRCQDEDRLLGQAVPRVMQDRPLVRVISCDPAPTEWNAIVVGDLEYDPHVFRFHMIDVIRWRGSDGGVNRLLREIDQAIDRYRPDYFIFESTAITKYLEQAPEFQLVRDRTRFIPHQTFQNKGDPDYGVRSLAVDIELGRLRFPWAEPAAQRAFGVLKEEAEWYPDGDTSDCLMAVWFVKWNWRRLRPPRMTPPRITMSDPDNTPGYLRRRLKGQKQTRADLRRQHGLPDLNERVYDAV